MTPSPPVPFCWRELRTTEVAAAARFYGAALGWRHEAERLVRGDVAVASIGALPEAARARGAPAHWLPHAGVADLDGAVRAWQAAGGEALGPIRRAVDGAIAVVRDPHGAVLGLSTCPAAAADVVAWHQLHVADAAAAASTYAAVLGWRPLPLVDLGPPVGIQRPFAWGAGDRADGAIAATVTPDGAVHPHWELHVAVADVDATVAAIRGAGGQAVRFALPGGDEVAACHDPQGAAFSVHRRAR
jgi:predicted enzyme related to lactoylglutathione lyase